MSLNRYSGHFQPGESEFTIYSKKDIELSFVDSTHANAAFKSGTIPGVVYLTNKRFAFESKGKSAKSPVQDFSACFGSISKLDIKQPIFGANAVTGTTSGEPGPDGFPGSVDWKMAFKSGGAIDFGKLLIKGLFGILYEKKNRFKTVFFSERFFFKESKIAIFGFFEKFFWSKNDF